MTLHFGGDYECDPLECNNVEVLLDMLAAAQRRGFPMLKQLIAHHNSEVEARAAAEVAAAELQDAEIALAAAQAEGAAARAPCSTLYAPAPTAVLSGKMFHRRCGVTSRDAPCSPVSTALIRPPTTLRTHHHTVVHERRHVFIMLTRTQVLVVAHP